MFKNECIRSVSDGTPEWAHRERSLYGALP